VPQRGPSPAESRARRRALHAEERRRDVAPSKQEAHAVHL